MIRIFWGWIFILLTSTVFSQRHDDIWRLSNNFGPSTNPTYNLNFANDSLRFDSSMSAMRFFSSAAFFSDSAGQLLFQTGGCFIADAQEDTLVNGDEIGIGSTQYGFYCEYGTYASWQFGFFLPFPGKEEKYILFHNIVNNYNTATGYLIIERFSDNYKVTAKNQILVQDSILIGGFMANKHANGRDWWLVAMPEKKNKIYKWLLDPAGLHSYGYQELGVPLMKSRHNEMVFSPDGSLLAQANPADDLRLWDFDRCTGELSNPRHYPHQDTADILSGNISGGMAISQDGRYLYRGNNHVAYQYDLAASDIGASITIVGRRNFDSPMVLGGIMELGPDGRIYIKPANGTAYTMHVITHPERDKSECGFTLDYYKFSAGYAAMPMFPNYRLGPIDGSSCDTLGLNNYPLAGFRYDRLAGLLVDFTSVSWYAPEVWHWDFGDPNSGTANQSTEKNPNHVFSAPGLYTVCLTVSNQNGADTLCKQIFVDESVGAFEPQASQSATDVSVYPNPAHTWVKVSGMQGADYAITNTLGTVVQSGTLISEVLQLNSLPSGIYQLTCTMRTKRPQTTRLVVIRP